MARVGERNLILGIDPGLHGALALIELSDDRPRIVDVLDMPTHVRNHRLELDIYLLGSYLKTIKLDRLRFAVMEDVGVMSGNEGRVAMFNFGRSTGIVTGALGALQVPIHFVKPAVWKSLMGLTRDKDDSRERAKILFPEASSAFRRAKDDGRAEAALLAYFGAERFT